MFVVMSLGSSSQFGISPSTSFTGNESIDIVQMKRDCNLIHGERLYIYIPINKYKHSVKTKSFESETYYQ
jgi:hypothetical protein